ncbi:uncharacterized protein LOC141631366 [Silene latifolia]|uniref:uncharacterized protein LOC141631366 n=1 Tax=Silene latifolia TaxID=37657 RepID=UPI003D77E251
MDSTFFVKLSTISLPYSLWSCIFVFLEFSLTYFVMKLLKCKGDPGTVTRRISPRLNNLSPTVDDPTPTFSRITTRMSPKSFVDVLRYLDYNQWCALEEIGFSSLFWLREFAVDYTASAKKVMEDMVVLDEKYAVGLQCFPGEECVKQAHSTTEFVYLTYGGGTEDVSCAPPWESSTLDEDEQFIVVANAAEKAYKLKLARAKHREQCAKWRNSFVHVTGEFSFDLGLEKDFAESEARLAAAKGVKRDRRVTGESSSATKRVHFMASPSYIPLSSNKQQSSRFDPLFSAIQDDTNVLTPLTAVHLQVADYVFSDRGTNNRRSSEHLYSYKTYFATRMHLWSLKPSEHVSSVVIDYWSSYLNCKEEENNLVLAKASPGLSDEKIYELFEARAKMELQLFPGIEIASIALSRLTLVYNVLA